MPPFIVTLTTMMFFSGLAIWITTLLTPDGSSIGNLPPGFAFLGQGRIGGMPFSVLIALVVCRRRARRAQPHASIGRWLFAIGVNPRAAEVSGVPVRRVVFWAYVICGACAGIAAILYTARLETGTPVLGQRILLDVVGAAVIGGVSLFGGKGKVIWVVFGALFLTVVDKGLSLLGLSLASVFAIKGGVILRGRDHRRAAPALRRGPDADAAPSRACARASSASRCCTTSASSCSPGEVLGLVGENGSGKSTTMNILGGVHQPDRGTHDPRRRSPTRRAAPSDAAGARHRLHPPGAQPLHAT